MTELGHFRRGRWFYRSALKMSEADSRGKILIYFSLIENRYKAGDHTGAKGATFGLLARYGLDEVMNTLQGVLRHPKYPPVDVAIVSGVIGKHAGEIAKNIAAISPSGR